MKMKIILSILMFLLLGGFAKSEEKKEYLSPDGKYCACIIPVPKAPYGSGESQIIIKTKNGKTLCSKSYGSQDGEHGFGVKTAAWTPDSNFFVYSLSSSGGHQAWHFPTNFVSPINCKTRKLDDYVGSVTTPDFVLSSPDIVKTTGREKAPLSEAVFEVRLSQKIKQEKKK
jgi:hypothetical protein